MRRHALLALVVVAGGCLSTPYQQRLKSERKILSQQLPAALEATKIYTGEVRTAKVRVYADTRYRKQNRQWEHGIDDQLDYANELLQPLLGVRLEPEFKKWDRDQDGSLRDALAELVKLDPGDDVAWVIGLTESLEMVSATTDELGMAQLLDAHLVLRGYSDVAERKMFANALPDMSDADRDEVHQARRRHKQTVLLLHELGHTLGAIHETDDGWIMHPSYSIKQSTISDRTRSLVLIALADRILPKATRDPPGTASQLLASIEAEDWGGWNATEKDELVGQLRNIIDAGKAGKTADDVPAAAYAQYDNARQLARAGKLDAAVEELAALLAAYPANATMRLLLCDIELHRSGAKSAPARKACDRAIELAAGDPRPHVTIAGAHLAAKDVAAARAELLLAEAKVANLPHPDDGWADLAQIYQSIGAIAWAEAAIGKSSVKDHPVAQWARTTRARYGVPATGKYAIKPEEEAAAVAAVRQILDAVYASKFSDAERAAKAAERKWPKLPGLAAARCDLDLRQEQLAAAKQRCSAAIAADPDASWGQYLMGIIVMRGTRDSDTRTGIDHLRKAIAADPELGQAWRALGKALHRAKDKEALAQLKSDYQARFGQALGD